MHHLFSLVLNVKDLSKAGDLFALPDRMIISDVSEILGKVREITTSVGYVQNDNDQSVVEIVVSRITATLRDTNCIESHIDALVDLLKTCLNHDLKPINKDMDPSHAKIASDILACIFLNYGKRSVMKQSIPIAVKFLHKGNKELTRNVSSYLPLAAIEHPDLVAEHIQPIVDSVIGGNYGLAKILPQIYNLNPERVNEHLMALANLLSLCDESEKSCILNLLQLVASNNSAVTVPLLEPSLPQLLDCLNAAGTIGPALGVLLEMAKESKLLQDHLDIINTRASKGCVSSSAMILAAKVFAEIGRNSSSHEKSIICLTKMIQLIQISGQDSSAQLQILREVVSYSQDRPTLMNATLIHSIQRYLANAKTSNGVAQMLLDKLWDVCSRRNVTVVNIREGDLTAASSTTAVSTSTELFLNQPTPLASSPPSYMFPNFSTGNGNLISRVHVSTAQATAKQRAATTYSGNNLNLSSTAAPRLHVAPIKPHNINVSGMRHPYQNPSPIQSAGYSSGSMSHHYKSLTRLPVPAITGEYKKRTALVSPYQNRSICSSIGLQDDFSAAALKSVRNSQNSVAIGIGNTSTGLPQHHYTGQQNPLLESGFSNSVYSVHPPQNMSLLKNYFSANSGTLSSSASIHGIGNNYGSRSTTHLSHNTAANATHAQVFGNKGLPSPTSRIIQQDNVSTPVHQNYHFSQPELRHNTGNDIAPFPNQPDESHSISVFEPYPMRDTVLHFCEKHLDKIKSYMEKICVRMPLPVKCTIEERKSKKSAKLHFSCQCRTNHCLYVNSRLFTMKTRYPRIWIHLMFLALQARSSSAMSSRDSSVSSLKNCWDTLKSESKSFLAIVTSAFPSARDQDLLSSELRNNGFFDLFEFNAIKSQWGCFFCNYPSRAMEFLSSEEPILEGCLKEKKGKWRLFKRWRTRYFTLSGGQLQAKGTDSSSTLNLHQILSLRVTRGQRSIPKAFEIFTEDKRVVLKPKDGKNASEWVQCLSVLVAKKAAGDRDTLQSSMYSGSHHLGKGCSMSALRTEV